MRLEFEHGVIRQWSPADKTRLVELADNRNIWRNMADRFPHPYTASDADEWFNYVSRMRTPTHWAIEIEGCAAGAVGIEIRRGMYRLSAGLGYWLGEPYWGRGVVTAAVRALVPALFERFDLARLEARVFEWNRASARVLEKAGFTREGTLSRSALKDGRLVDQFLYALIDRRRLQAGRAEDESQATTPPGRACR